MVGVGTLRHEVVLLKRVQLGVTDLNEPIFEWVEALRFWAAKIHRAEDEEFAAQQRYATRAVTFRTHWMNDIESVDRLDCEGEIYDVKGVRELGFRSGIEIAAELIG